MSAVVPILAVQPLDQPFLVVMCGLILALTGREIRLARLRTSLNRALHEVRRPLQVLALEGPGPSVRQAIQAVGRLDRTLNGGGSGVDRSELIACRLMVDSCVRRWRSRAHLAGAEIELSWLGGDVLVRGDGVVLCGAIENLILNAIEHGGPDIRVEAKAIGRWVRVEITDSGRSSRPPERQGSPAEIMARQRGDENHGHGLGIAREAIENHGGRLELTFDESGSVAALALPCSRIRRPAGSVRVNW